MHAISNQTKLDNQNYESLINSEEGAVSASAAILESAETIKDEAEIQNSEDFSLIKKRARSYSIHSYEDFINVSTQSVKKLPEINLMISAIAKDLEGCLEINSRLGNKGVEFFFENQQLLLQKMNEYVKTKLSGEVSFSSLDLKYKNIFTSVLEVSSRKSRSINLIDHKQVFINYMQKLVKIFENNEIVEFQKERIQGLKNAISSAEEELEELYSQMNFSTNEALILFEPKFIQLSLKIEEFLQSSGAAYDRGFAKEKMREFIQEMDSIAEEIFAVISEKFPTISKLAKAWDERATAFSWQFGELFKAKNQLTDLESSQATEGEVLINDLISAKVERLSGRLEKVKFSINWFESFYNVIGDIQELYRVVSSRLLSSPLRLLEEQREILNIIVKRLK
jgi:hypothetical protein